PIHKIQKIDFSGSQMNLKVDGKEVVVNLIKISSKLLRASKKEVIKKQKTVIKHKIFLNIFGSLEIIFRFAKV
ncbi:MAG: hypothetical protein HQL13_03935, partial [Candidatus Omnitrophica bacterium]|nr:hypothetical protein [Candidatus Omnitrophota bacterium]